MSNPKKKVLFGVTGSIATYKAVFLLRLLIKDGYNVQVVMTQSATDYVSALTFSVLSKQEVIQDFHQKDQWKNHINIVEAIETFLIYPATNNTIAKLAHGISDNILTAMYLSARCPVIVAPAMDGNMWSHSITQQNITKLKSHGCHILDVEHGELASGLTGYGRLADPEKAMQLIKNNL